MAAAVVLVVGMLASGPIVWAYCYQWASVEVESDSQCYSLYESNIGIAEAEYDAAMDICNNFAAYSNCYEECTAYNWTSYGCASLCGDGVSGCMNQVTAVYNIQMLYYATALNECVDACPE